MTLILDKWGCLTKSKHTKVKASRAFGYLPGHPDLIEVQALVKLPKYGERPGMKAPYLPKAKLSQLVTITSSLEDIDLSDLTFEINCAIPGGRPYFHTLDLPLVVSMLSSYFQRPIPSGSIFVGEVDLASEIRPMQESSLPGLAEILAPNNLSPLAQQAESIFVAERNERDVKVLLADKNLKIKVQPVTTLESLVRVLWPDASQGM
jgi:DNA repair protein RadA/Sms